MRKRDKTSFNGDLNVYVWEGAHGCSLWAADVPAGNFRLPLYPGSNNLMWIMWGVVVMTP